MSLVENLVSQIATQGLGGVTKPLGFDMEDDTFSKLLEKQMSTFTNQPANTIGEMGVPAGMIIEPLDGTEFAETLQDQMEAVGETKFTKEPITTEAFEMKDIDMGDYYSKLLKASSEGNPDFMNFAKKHASNAYGLFGKSYITDVIDFAEDLASAI